MFGVFPTTALVSSGSTADNIRVCARFRPLNRQEQELVASVSAPGNAAGNAVRPTPQMCVQLRNSDDVSVEVISPDNELYPFTFTRVFRPDAKQEAVYRDVGEPMVEDILSGYNACIFVYGQTGSGKTYTMMGANAADASNGVISTGRSGPSSARYSDPSPAPVSSPQLQVTSSSFLLEGPHAGIIPRAVNDLFQRIATADQDLIFDIKLFFVEIYMEHVRDLLEPANTNLNVRGDPSTNSFYVEDCQSPYVSSAQEVLALVELGLRNRTTAATKMNDVSSRSHCLLGITVKSTHSHRGETKIGKLYLVDLAGTEKVAKTKAEGVQLEEAKLINKSLTTLGLVIKNLTEGRSSHIPYRDSKLTKILQDALGGNSRTSLIVCCSPSALHYQETHSTLRFGARAKHIKNRAVVNKEYTPAELTHLLMLAQGEIDRKNAEIARLKRGDFVADSLPTPPPTSVSDEQATEEAERRDREWEARLATLVVAQQQREADETIFRAQLENKDDTIREQQVDLLAAREAMASLQGEVASLNEEINLWQKEYTALHHEQLMQLKRFEKERQARTLEHSLLEKLLDSCMKARLDIQSIRSWCLDAMRELQLGTDTATMFQHAANSAILTTAISTSLRQHQLLGPSEGGMSATDEQGNREGHLSPIPVAGALVSLAPEAAQAAIATLTQRLQTVEKQYVDLELTWRDLVTENGSLMLELQLADKKLAIRHDRIENLKAGLKQERQMNRDTLEEMELEKRQMKEKLIEARSDAEYWRHRFEALNLAAVGNGGSNASARASASRNLLVSPKQTSLPSSSGLSFASPNAAASRVVKHIRGGGGGLLSSHSSGLSSTPSLPHE